MKYLIISCLVVSSTLSSFATHLKGGYISLKHASENTHTYEITVTVFTDMESAVLFGGDDDILNFGDGTSMTVPETQSTVLPGGYGISSFTIEHTYSGPGHYVVTYTEPNRTEGIVNMSNSVSTLFGLKSAFTIDPFLPAYNSPDILEHPIFSFPIGTPLSTGLATGDPSNMTLYYTVQTPFQATGYSKPENFTINHLSGSINWDTKFNGDYVEGEYAFCVRIQSQYEGFDTGYTTVDFEITLEESDEKPSLMASVSDQERNRFYVPENEQRTVKFIFQNTAEADLSMYAVSEINESINFTTYDSLISDKPVKVGSLLLENTAEIRRTQPYVILVRGKSETSSVYFEDLIISFYTEDVNKPDFITQVDKDFRPGTNNASVVKVFPNPFENIVHFKYPDGKATLIIYTVEGEKVFERILTGESEIDLSHVSGNQFVYQISYNNRTISGKLSKK